MRMPAARTRRGSAILMVILFVVITAAVATALIPVLTRVDRLDRAQKTSVILGDLAYQITNGVAADKDFRQSISKHPGKISQLVFAITASDFTGCTTTTYLNPQVNNWPGAGPFTYYPIVANVGIMTPMGLVNDQTVRTPNTPNVGTLALTMSNVDMEDVEIMDMLIDFSDGIGAGRIRWGAITNGLTTLSYTFTIDNQC